MSFFSHLFHHVVHAGIHEVMHTMEERNLLSDAQFHSKIEMLRNDIERWIINGIPIPKEIMRSYPFYVTEICIKLNRKDLVKDLLPAYEKQKKINARVHKLETISTWVGNFFSLIGTMSFVAMLILLVYMLITGC